MIAPSARELFVVLHRETGDKVSVFGTSDHHFLGRTRFLVSQVEKSTDIQWFGWVDSDKFSPMPGARDYPTPE